MRSGKVKKQLRGCQPTETSNGQVQKPDSLIWLCRKKNSPEKPSRDDYAALVEMTSPPETGDQGADVSAITITKIYAGGICCPSETPLIMNILQPLPGVLEVRVQAYRPLGLLRLSSDVQVVTCGFCIDYHIVR